MALSRWIFNVIASYCELYGMAILSEHSFCAGANGVLLILPKVYHLPDELSRQAAVSQILWRQVKRAQQLYVQRMWRSYMGACREGDADSITFVQQLHGVVRPSLLQLFTMRSRLLQLTWCTADIPADLFTDCVSSITSLQHLDVKSSKPGAMDVLHSVCVRLMRAVILKELAARDDTGALKTLSSIPSPFDSWTSSAPANEDDWLDPADEVIDTECMFAWEEQVRCIAGIWS